MKISKSLDIDLNIISPQKHIRIHEGDVDSVDILIGVSVDDESVDLDGVTIKYDATINNYLAEQDADGSVVDGKISIPVTQNMTAMSGLLLIDVRMIRNDQILHTQTICATVEKAVVNGSTYIDLDKITIIQRMNALEKQMEHVEEIIENFDTSKLIVSTNRPPSGAPVEVDVDLLRVGDTWILSGDNIVYKLVEAQYNYQPDPETEPYHKFTWQPLNERYVSGNTEPPTAVTYQAVIYTINDVQWSWLPVPEYFTGDHYHMLVDEESTYYVCKSNVMSYTGVCTYTWREEGGSIDAYTKAETNELLSNKMDLAPLNPTSEQIAALPAGQIFYDGDERSLILKDGRFSYTYFPTKAYVDIALYEKQKRIFDSGIFVGCSYDANLYSAGDYYYNDTTLYWLQDVRIIPGYSGHQPIYEYCWRRSPTLFGRYGGRYPSPTEREDPATVGAGMFSPPIYHPGDFIQTLSGIYLCTGCTIMRDPVMNYRPYYSYSWEKVVYTKAEIDTKIGDIGTRLDQVRGVTNE